MDSLLDVLSRSSVHPHALPDALARGQTRFSGREPTLDELEAWVRELPTHAPHLFPSAPSAGRDDATRLGIAPQIWATMSASERLTRAREAQPVVSRAKPAPLELTASQISELASMSATARLTTYRQWQAQKR
jgi:hypothetical protein